MTGRCPVMLKSLMKKLKNLIDINAIEATLKESKDDVLASADEFFSEHINFERFISREFNFEKITGVFCQVIKEIETKKSQQLQALYLREETLKALEIIAVVEYFLNDKNQLGDIAVISRKDREFDGLEIQQVIEKASNICSENVELFCCLRQISGKFFDDASNFDYARLYLSICCQIEQHENNTDISEAKNKGGDLFEMFLPHLHQMKQEMRKNILEGMNYDSTPEEEEEEEKLEDNDEKNIEKHKEISEQHFEELRTIFQDRIERLNNEELYVADGYAASDFGNIVRFDTGMMLIAMTECVEDRESCVKAVQKLMFDWLGSLDLSAESQEQLNSGEIPMDEQLTYLEMREESDEGGWLSGVLHIGTLMVFGISAEDYQDFDTNEKNAIGELAFKVGGDAWQIYAQTKNVFGHEMSETWFGADED